MIEARCDVARAAGARAALLALRGARLEEAHGSFLRVSLARESADLAQAFEALESLKRDGAVLHSSVSQDSLDNVFLGFAARQEEERGRIGGLAYAAAQPHEETESRGAPSSLPSTCR